jgi:aquaporin NIP
MRQSNLRKYLAEFLGTFALVFCGTGAIVINQHTNGAIGHIGIAITFGLIVLAMIYTFGETSGAHFNPAVTLSFAIVKRFETKQILPYIFFQLCGAFLASIILKILFPENLTLGATIPSGSNIQSLILEFIMSYILVLVIMNVAHGSKEVGIMAGIAIGAVVLLEAMFGGPISGASMNPARSIAPAVIAGNVNSLWIYIFAPIAGGILASLTWKIMSNKT